MAREEAEQLLLDAKQECGYVLRKKKGAVVISVANKGSMAHLMVGKSNGRWVHKGNTLPGTTVRGMAEQLLTSSGSGTVFPVNILDTETRM